MFSWFLAGINDGKRTRKSRVFASMNVIACLCCRRSGLFTNKISDGGGEIHEICLRPDIFPLIFGLKLIAIQELEDYSFALWEKQVCCRSQTHQFSQVWPGTRLAKFLAAPQRNEELTLTNLAGIVWGKRSCCQFSSCEGISLYRVFQLRVVWAVDLIRGIALSRLRD